MSGRKEPQRWAWALSGSGHFFAEAIALMRMLVHVDIFISRAGEELLPMYRHHLAENDSQTMRFFKERTASSVPVARFYQGLYHTLVMAPMSSNTVAKCVVGISDSLVTNVFAQAGKCRVPCLFFPCDTAEELTSRAPKGMVTVYPRQIDLANSRQLATFTDVTVFWSFADFELALRQRQQALLRQHGT